MNPILKYIRNIFASQREMGRDAHLSGKEKADLLLQQLIEDKCVPGLAISVRKNNRVYFQKGYGFANLEQEIPIDPLKTVFRVASVSKPIAATALATMVADRKLDLDASFYNYVPYYPKKEYDFTLRQLAGHTAGIRGYRGAEYGLNLPMGIRESLSLFQDDALVFKPGTQYLYSSYDWVLISLAIEEVSGIPFADYVQEKVLKRFELVDTFPEIPRENFSNKATFYSRYRLGFRKAIQVDNRFKLAGGGYLSTSSDVAHFGQAFLDASLGEDPVMSQFLAATFINGESTYYGLGWQVSEDKMGRPYFGHVGNGIGGYAVFYVYPDEDMVFSILINCTNPRVEEILEEAVSLLICGKKG
ncbi:D-alanyl-D-alanine carboxypeptidase [Arenibacter antarcticus]|uniref:Serine hydrolase domain-containing protein n=1 Tax=Arenibacter antarcticus TaxID=2040469 RepID=A0ABW5VCG1_9FLAO|nr:serine hydrolase domain-containing protein [Arenibacter sp. H213]MCM4169441.1 D-alanyl-D-alanine carboxypeptidase [Arenibacter sp. H213]